VDIVHVAVMVVVAVEVSRGDDSNHARFVDGAQNFSLEELDASREDDSPQAPDFFDNTLST
jgi:hypothetical protein